MTTAVSPPVLQAVPAQLVKFLCVGVASTVVHLGLFAALHAGSGTQVANLLALVVATVVNTALNRRFTFGVTTSEHLGRHHLQGMLIFGVTWATSALALGALPTVLHDPSTFASTTALGASMALSTVLRFVLMRTWVFRPA
jgi:putative flippase GtrA